MRGRERLFSLAAGLTAILLAVFAFRSDGYWRSLLLNVSTTALGLSAALAIVNFYLDMSAKKTAVYPLLRLIAPSIEEHHNQLLDKMLARFSRPQFQEMAKRYHDNKSDPHALTHDERNAIYEIVEHDKDSFFLQYDRLEQELRELAIILGWSFSPAILSDSFNCRYAIAKLKATCFDGSDGAKLQVCENFLDVDINSYSVFAGLVELLGLNKDEIYAD